VRKTNYFEWSDERTLIQNTSKELSGKEGFRGNDRPGGGQAGDSKRLWTMRAYG